MCALIQYNHIPVHSPNIIKICIVSFQNKPAWFMKNCWHVLIEQAIAEIVNYLTIMSLYHGDG